MDFALLDDAFRCQLERLDPFQLETVSAWQRTDRFYEEIQGLQRGTLDAEALSPVAYAELRRRIRALDRAIASGVMPFSMVLYRGVRSLARTFGVQRASDIALGDGRLQGYTAASVVRDVAVTEFVGANGALLELHVHAGTPALWVAGVGRPDLRRQGEVLLRANLRVRHSGTRQDGDLAVVSMQVIAP